MDSEPRRLPRKVMAVIFDLDDTLVESTVNYSKFKQLVIDRIVSHGEDPALYSPDETVVSILARFEKRLREAGLSEREVRSRLAEMDSIMDQVELERVDETSPLEGADELLKLLRDKGVKVGVLTRGCEAYAAKALKKAGLDKLVDAVECRNSTTRPKPDPESYLNLVSELGVEKEETMLVGDHAIDAKCAERAGVPFVGVLTGSAPEETLRAAGSVAVFPGIRHMIPWVRKLLEQGGEPLAAHVSN